MHHQIDSLAYSNRLRYLPPTQKISFTLILLVLGYLGSAPVRIAIALWLWAWLVVYAGIPRKVYTSLLLIPLSFGLLTVPAIALSLVSQQQLATVDSDIVAKLSLGNWYIYLSQQGMQQVQTLLLRAIALISCCYFLLLTTPIAEILRVLTRLGVSQLILDLLTLMYRFIFLLTEVVTEIIDAQQSRLGYSSWRRSMYSLAILITQLLQRSLESYRQVSLGLNSRGFTGNLHFWYPTRHKSNPRYTLEAISGCLVLCVYTIWQYAFTI